MSAQNNNSPKQPDKKKQIIIGVICVILLLNVMWTVMQNKFAPKLDEFKKEINTAIAALDSRITKIEEVNDQYTDYFVTVFLFDEEGLLQYEDIFYNYNGSGPINYNSPSWRMIYEYYYE